MKRFVTYIYEYERGVPGRNVGFIRTDIRENGCRMEVHIRGLDRFKGKGMVYLIADSESPIGIPAAEILISQGMGHLKLTCPSSQIGKSGYHINQLQALVIRYGGGKMLAGSFVNEPAEDILRGNFEILGAENEAPSNEQESLPAGSHDGSSPDSPTAADADPLVSSDSSAAADSAASSESAATADSVVSSKSAGAAGSPVSVESLPADDSAGTEPERSSPQPCSAQDLSDSAPHITYQKIEITDIRKLPKHNWHLCNNSFLVHGFFNYRYLMLKTVETPNGTDRFLGVPGIYEQPERMMALLFGFPEFEAARTGNGTDKQPDTMQKNPPPDANGVFGYWMCQLAED